MISAISSVWPSDEVCPITQPMYYEAGSKPLHDVPKGRVVYLPSGCHWYDFWIGELYGGGQKIYARAPLDSIPLLVKLGSIIPMDPFLQYTDEKPGEPLEIRVYPDRDGEFSLYEDAGDGYECGEYSWIPLKWDEVAACLTIGGP